MASSVSAKRRPTLPRWRPGWVVDVGLPLYKLLVDSTSLQCFVIKGINLPYEPLATLFRYCAITPYAWYFSNTLKSKKNEKLPLHPTDLESIHMYFTDLLTSHWSRIKLFYRFTYTPLVENQSVSQINLHSTDLESIYFTYAFILLWSKINLFHRFISISIIKNQSILQNQLM